MKHEKKSFIFFDDILDLMVEMSPEEVKTLMLSIRAYRMGDTVPTFEDRYMQMALDKAINLIGSADERYKEKCERLRQNFQRKNGTTVQQQKQADAQPQPSSTDNQQPPKEEKKRTYRPFQPDCSFITDPSMREVFRVWLEYKKARKESYRTQASVEACYANLVKLAGGDPGMAKLIVSQSLANNWAGLFELKTNGTNNNTTQYERRVASERQLGTALARQSAAELAAGQPGADDEGAHVPIAL